jgi:hypothetical protein
MQMSIQPQGGAAFLPRVKSDATALRFGERRGMEFAEHQPRLQGAAEKPGTIHELTRIGTKRAPKVLVIWCAFVDRLVILGELTCYV